MATNKPVLTSVSDVKTPVLNSQYTRPTHWSFSFRFFRQKKHFGFSHVDSTWFISLFERLSDLSSIDKDEFDRSHYLRQKYRYHQINWNHKNVPIRREDLDWVDKDVIENPEEFPFYQFHVSQALGRIVGYWDSNSIVFQIVLLDPMHNIQPSKINDYKIKDSYPADCRYSRLMSLMDHAKQKSCVNENCGFRPLIESGESHLFPDRIIIIQVSEDTFNNYEDQLEKYSPSQILEYGILAIDEESKAKKQS